MMLCTSGAMSANDADSQPRRLRLAHVKSPPALALCNVNPSNVFGGGYMRPRSLSSMSLLRIFDVRWPVTMSIDRRASLN